MLHLIRWSPACFLLAAFLFPASSPAQAPPREQVFEGHQDAVTMGRFSPDGTAVVTVSFDHTARLWDLASQSQLRQYTQHTGPVYCVAISGDGTTLVSGAQDNTLRIWDLPLGKPLRAWTQPPAKNHPLAISPGGDTVLSAAADQHVHMYSIAAADQAADRAAAQPTAQRSGHTAEVLSLAYHKDGAYFASSDAAGRVLLWSPYLEKPQHAWAGHEGAVRQLGFLANAPQLLSAGDDGVVRLWQWTPVASTHVELGNVQILDWSLSSNLSQAACITADGRALVLNVASGEITSEYPKPAVAPTAISHAPNNTWFCVADQAGSAHVLNFSDGSPRGSVTGHHGRIDDVAVHPDSIRFATCGGDGTVRLWAQPSNAEEPQQPLQLWQTDAASPVPATCLVFTADQQHLLCGAADGKVRQWNVNSGEMVRSIDAHTGPIREIVVTPNSQTVLTLGDDQTLRSWQFSDGAALQTMTHPSPIRRVTASPNSTRAVVAGEDGSLRVWDLGSGQLLQTFKDSAAAITGVGFLSDGQSIVSVSQDKSLRMQKTSILQAMPIHSGAVRSMALYAGGSQVLTCGDDQRIVMTNVANGQELRQYRVAEPLAPEDPPADANLAAATPAAVAAEQSPAPPTYQNIAPTMVAIRGDNQRVAAGTEAGQVLVWNLNNGETPLLSFSLDSPVTAISYSPDNQKLAVATAAQSVHVFGPPVTATVPPQELVQHQQFSTDAAVSQLVFGTDNQTLWASLVDGQIQQWNYAGIAQVRQMNHGGPVYGVAISNDGKLAVSCSTDQTVRVWDTTNGQQKFQLNGHLGAVHTVAMSNDETFAVSSGADGTLRLWDIVGGRQLKQLIKFDATMYSIAIHPSGQLIAAAGADRKVHLLDMITGAERHTLEGHSDYIHCVAFDTNGQRLLSYGYAGHLKIWNSADGRLLHESRIGTVGNYAQFSPDGKSVLLCNGDGSSRVVPLP